MSLTHMIAIAGGGEEDRETLMMAAQLAVRHAAVVEVLPAHPDAALDMIALGVTLGAHLSADVLKQLEASESRVQSGIDTSAQAVAQDCGIAFGDSQAVPRMRVLDQGLRPAIGLAAHLDLADLVVFGQHYLDKGDRRRAVLAEALIDCRTPVLVARGAADRLAGVAAIAWDGSLQAGRAVHAALPLLDAASRIVVVQQSSGLDRLIANPDIGRLCQYLAAYGLPPPEVVKAEQGDEGDALLAAARLHGADLFVAGAYGHSRFREIVFGGATRAFVNDAEGPCLLLAH